MRISNKHRKAISPVLATVILIAITLIAAIAIAGFVFGLFGSFTSSAQVSAQVTRCTYVSATNSTCLVQLTNSGTSNVLATSCSVQMSGAAAAGTLGATKSVPASGGNPVRCSVAGAQQTVGSQVVGSLAMSNGASVPFSGVWS